MHLYLHVPFCHRRCSYCDFAIAVRREVPSDAYATAVLAEWKQRVEQPLWAAEARLDTVYFGGGTPSLLGPRALERILDAVRTDRTVMPGAEITLEANPEDVTAERASAWKALGINRVSLGAQSFDAVVLAWMHRTHGAGDTALAVEVLRAAGIENLSLDLIFGLPAGLDRDWAGDLTSALALDPDHLSLYGLTVEPHTVLARWSERGSVSPVHEERYVAEFLEADRRLSEAGYEHYEVSNYARPGRRALHNAAYWRRATYLGLGPSAHSASGRERRWNLREWSAWARVVKGGGDPTAGSEQLDAAAEALERRYLALRTSEGVPAGSLPPSAIREWTVQGWIRSVPAGDRIALTPEGWLRLDSLAAAVG